MQCEGGFSRAVVAEYSDKLTGRHIQIDAPQGGIAVFILEVEIPYLNQVESPAYDPVTAR